MRIAEGIFPALGRCRRVSGSLLRFISTDGSFFRLDVLSHGGM
jgi:hypothetical protein